MANPPNAVNEIMRLYAAGRYAEMEAGARKLAKMAGARAIADELLGIALCAQNRFADALAPLQSAARSVPGEPQFLENLALCQRQLGDLGAAEQSLRASLNLRPSLAEARAALASILRALGRLDDAETQLRAALVLQPRKAAFHFNLGNILGTRVVIAKRRRAFAPRSRSIPAIRLRAPTSACCSPISDGSRRRRRSRWRRSSASARSTRPRPPSPAISRARAIPWRAHAAYSLCNHRVQTRSTARASPARAPRRRACEL
jgi:tetratricopeptide (TPR) repeat protein